eukprot:811916-Ditylum_brightwellii.AAC.1
MEPVMALEHFQWPVCPLEAWPKETGRLAAQEWQTDSVELLEARPKAVAGNSAEAGAVSWTQLAACVVMVAVEPGEDQKPACCLDQAHE